MQQKTISTLISGLFLGVLLVTQTMFIVPQTQQVLVLQFGNPVKQYVEPGLKFKIPFIQQLRAFDARVLDVDPPPEEIILADQKRLVVDTFARYKITDMLKFHQAMGTENQAVARLHSVINSQLRSSLGSVTVQAVLSEKRAGIMTAMRDEVNRSVERFGIKIVDVRIGRADLPSQTSQSIYARMRSEREREAAEFRAQGQQLSQEIKSKADAERTVILAEANKKSQIMKGEGDEQAIKIYADAFGRDPAFYGFYRTMEAYKKSLKESDTTFVISPDSEFFRFFNNANGNR